MWVCGMRACCAGDVRRSLGTARSVLVPWTPLLPHAVGVGAHAKAPGALAVACAVGPRGGSGAFLMDYTTCFSFLRFVLVRGDGEVLFCCWG